MRHIIQKIKNLKSKLNFFDVAVFFVLLLALVFLAYNRLQRQSTWVNIRLSVENTDWWYQGSSPSYWYAKNLHAGDVILDSFGNKLVEVINIDNYENYGPYRNIYVDLRIRVDFDKIKNQYLYDFKPLVIGSSLTFNFSKEQLRGLVIRIGDQEIDYVYKTIQVEIKSNKETEKVIMPSLAEKIKVGDKSYDMKGDLIAEILDVESNVSSHYEFSDLRGKSIKVYDPDFRDLKITLKIKTFGELDRIFYINNAAIKIGNEIWIQFPDYALESSRIIDILD